MVSVSPNSKPQQWRPCEIEGCAHVVFSRRICHMHYMRKKRTGTYDSKPQHNIKLESLTEPGKNIVALVTERNMNVTALRGLAKVSSTTLLAVMYGYQDVRFSAYVKIANAFDIHVWELLRPGAFYGVDSR